MKIWRLAAALLMAAPLWASYSYYFSDDLTSPDNTKWAVAGSVSPASGGMGAADADGGSLISRVPIPDGSGEAEVRVTIRLAASGGRYTEFLDATPAARTGGAGSGDYLAFEMQNPQLDGNGGCQADFVVLQSVHGGATLLASFPHS